MKLFSSKYKFKKLRDTDRDIWDIVGTQSNTDYITYVGKDSIRDETSVIKSGVSSLTFENCKEGNLKNYKISGNVGTNLFDMNLITNSKYETHPDENYFDVKAYSITAMSPSNFMIMSGLKAGDTVTTSRTKEVIQEGEGNSLGAWGRVTLLSKVSGVSSVVLCEYDKNIGIATIPDDFNPNNYYGLMIYGINKTDSILRIHNMQIVKGSYTEETMPEYEPYKCVGDKTKNLFNMNLITNSTAYEIHPDENYIDVIMYGAGTGISPEKFLSTFGLKAGDTITTSRTVEIIEGGDSYNPGISGRISFASKVSGVSSFTLCASNKDVDTVTIPENFNTDNYYTLILYGINKSGAILRIHNLQIVKGSYTAETMPEYEPYGYKIPITVGNNTTNIFLNAPLGIGESIEYKTDKLPDIALSDGTNIISAETEVKPTAFEAEYYSLIENVYITLPPKINNKDYAFGKWNGTKTIGLIDGYDTSKKYNLIVNGKTPKSNGIQKKICEFEDVTFNNTSTGKIVYYNTVNNSINFNNVSNIDAVAFSHCDGKAFENIVIPDNIAKIEQSVFSDNNSVKTVTLSNNVKAIDSYAFQNCKNLETINLENVTTLNQFAFYNCTSLNNVTLNSKLKSIGRNVFCNTTSLSNITLPTSINEINQYGFYKSAAPITMDFLNQLKYIDPYAFYGVTNMPAELVFTNKNLNNISYANFDLSQKESKQLTKLVFPETMNGEFYIGRVAFQMQNKITNELKLPYGTVYIGDYAFNHCSGFSNKTTNIPSTVQIIGGVPNTITSGSSSANYYQFRDNLIMWGDDDINTWIGDHTFYDFAVSTNEEFTVGEDGTNESQYFKAVNGVLYGKNRLGVEGIYRLCSIPRCKGKGKTGDDLILNVEEGVIHFDGLGYGQNQYLEELVIPNSYTIITYEDFKSLGTSKAQRGKYPLNFDADNHAGNELTSFVYQWCKLKRFNVKADNTKYTAIDGCIYTKDEKTLMAVPYYYTGELNIPEGVTTIGYGAIYCLHETSCTKIVIPSTVTEIDKTTLSNMNRVAANRMKISNDNTVYGISDGKIVKKG